VLGGLLLFNLILVAYLFDSPGVAKSPAGQQPTLQPGLRLLRELSDRERMALIPAEVVPERELALELLVEQPHEATLVCRIWGPFSSIEGLERVQATVDEVGEVVEVQTGQVQSTPDFLVYIESDNNIDNAHRLLKELDGQSLDAYIIAGGEFMNSVSAGVFSSQERAERQLRRLTDLGYSAEIEALERVQTVFHLMAMVPEAFEAQSQAYKDCPAIASVE
jgi:hypothetical protein